MSIREQRLGLAQSRALGEEAERYNPVNPIRGSGATPSMGLSQFRGGKAKKMKAGSRPRAVIPRNIADEGRMSYTQSGDDRSPPSPMSAVASPAPIRRQYNRIALATSPAPAPVAPALVAPAPVAPALAPLPVRKIGEGDMSDSDDDAGAQGEHLAQHLHSLHGGSFLKRFVGGMDTGRFEGEGGKHLLGRTMMPRLKVEEMSSGPGFQEAVGGNHCNGCMCSSCCGGNRVVGAGDDYDGGGRLKKAKRVMAQNDGRLKRAEVVKRIMAEKGMKMIEASKYVKEHKLY